MEPEVIRFCNPKVDGGATLFVAGFPSELSREKKWHILQESFAQFGIIHQILFPSSESQPFAFVSFYSLSSAARAKASLDQALRVENRPLRVSSLVLSTVYSLYVESDLCSISINAFVLVSRI